MKTCCVLVLLSAVLFSAGPATAKTFYLTDGSAITYKKVWQQGNSIFLLINRDTLVEFSPDEVDQRRTLKAAGLKTFPRLVLKKRKPARAASAERADAPRVVHGKTGAADTEKELVFSDTLPAKKEGGEAASSNESGDGQGLSQELLTAYESLHRAMKARKLEEVKRHLSSRNASSLGPREQAMIESGISLMPPNRTVAGSSTSPDGSSATLNLNAYSGKNTQKPSAIGTISFVREDGAWKLDHENWEMKAD